MGSPAQYRAVICYDGTEFHGFQWQQGCRTVQQTLEEAIQQRGALIGRVNAAGRTDAGVHALGQVVSFTAELSVPVCRISAALNGVLPADVAVSRAEEACDGFHARFSASARVYWYLISAGGADGPLMRRHTAVVRKALDVQAMNMAAQTLIGEHDFRAFAAETEPDASTCRRVMRCWVRRWRGLILVQVEANAFLRGMARTLTGTLIEVGAGKRTVQNVAGLLDGGQRGDAGPTAPAQGLYLYRVRYGKRQEFGARRSALEQEGRDVN
ncbi:MAG: tRNA pseudouridine(38-40) synthase TruA [Armatimonadetes bacterium]|nr:tRNA pseudouridine(38-40) synthase TruA [Armatimonadota bacterium]MDE2206854.1 tRNA pseudouridine(38-40) synthase TruA [Armatimonadota bacterium]